MANMIDSARFSPHRAHEVRLPGKACQPEPSSPARTAYSVWRSVSADPGTGTNFQRIKHEAREKYREDNNTVKDAYEDKDLGFLGKSKNRPTESSAELDHVISAKSIHDDRGRVLSGCSTKDLADREVNLQWTNEHLNKSSAFGRDR